MSYKKILEALRAYEPKELIKDRYEADGKCCAVGVVIPATRTQSDPIDMVYSYHEEVREAARALECNRDELENLQFVNDSVSTKHTPKERYDYVLGWLEEVVAEEEGR